MTLGAGCPVSFGAAMHHLAARFPEGVEAWPLLDAPPALYVNVTWTGVTVLVIVYPEWLTVPDPDLLASALALDAQRQVGLRAGTAV